MKTTLAPALALVLLSGCQSTAPVTAQQRLQMGLGMAQQPRQLVQAELTLKRAQQDFLAQNDLSGQAQAAFALGELYKSKTWQAAQSPPATVAFYRQSARQFEQAAGLYDRLQRPALQGAAQIGAANAWLLADDVARACPWYEQARAALNHPQAREDAAGYAQLQRGVGFFAELGTVCQIQSQLRQWPIAVTPAR